VFSLFFFSSFKVSGLTLSVIHFELSFVQEEIRIQFQSFTGGHPVFPPPLLEEAIFSPTYTFGTVGQRT
jgi:hypothetical protein